MAIKNFNVCKREDDIKLLSMFIVAFLILIWLATPPGNKFAQMCFWGHNVQYAVTRVLDKNVTEEYKFYWKNAIYLAKMNDKKSLVMMDKAIETMPKYFTERQTELMYKERAKIKCMFKDYKGALDDYLRVTSLDNDDILRVAFLFKIQARPNLAVSYCNKLLSIEMGFADGCACMADVYAGVGKVASSVKIYNYLISKEPNVAKYYIARANYKKVLGDNLGERNDIYLAELKDPNARKEYYPVTDVLLAKNIKLSSAF